MKKVHQLLKTNKKFLLSTHVSPDPDALCSEMALMYVLKALGKTVVVLNEEPVPERFLFLPGVKSIKNSKQCKKFSYDVAIILDCGGIDRIGKVQAFLDPSKPLINIDHHVTNTKFGSTNLIDVESSSTCELLHDLFKVGKFKLDDKIALHLYGGIMTDTGSFRYENTTSKTHAIVSELKRFKIRASELYTQFYEQLPLKDLKFFMKVASQFDSLMDGRVVCVELKKSVVKQFSKTFDLRDMIFKFLRTIQNVEVLVIVTEFEKSKSRVNLRSSGDVNVAKIASHFGGGGHKKASGCVVNYSLKQTRSVILREIKKVL